MSVISAPAVIPRPLPQHVEGERRKARCWWRENPGQPVLWGGLCLAMTVLLVYRLAAASFKTSDSLRPDDLMEEPAAFDSFSEPFVACAVLQQEAERLLLAYRQDWDREQTSLNLRAGDCRTEDSIVAVVSRERFVGRLVFWQRLGAGPGGGGPPNVEDKALAQANAKTNNE